MAKIQVILLEDVAGQGRKGEIVTVSDGYAHNFLLKGKKGVLATPEELQKIENRKKKEAKKHEEERNKSLELKKLLESKVLNISHNIFWENNILEVIKYIFVWYGIKNLYVLIEKIGVKSNILKHGISILFGLSYPMVVFVIGALVSFEFIEVKEIRM